MKLPRTAPWRSTASMAYSEHVGTYRHAGRNMGDTAHLYPRSKSSTTFLEIYLMRLQFKQKRPFLAYANKLTLSFRRTRSLALLAMTTTGTTRSFSRPTLESHQKPGRSR